jgi:hypothetical protein
MSACDPLRTVWDALEGLGYQPHGNPYDFRSRCPAHQGANRESLHVGAGVDGRALLHCLAHHCDVERIVAAVGLVVADLFPAGHRNARRRQLRDARRADFAGNARTLANVVKALEELGDHWRGEVVCDCPMCGRPNARLVVPSCREHRPYLHCEAACTAGMFSEALAGRLEDRREAA